MPKHHRHMDLLQAKKAGNERNIGWLERLHNILEVAEVETMTPDELCIHIFAESVDSTMTKLALDILVEDDPKITKLKHTVRASEVSKWCNQGNQNKGYGKAAIVQREKHCTKCDYRGHTTSECWGPCTYSGKYNHCSEKCFHKSAPKQEP